MKKFYLGMAVLALGLVLTSCALGSGNLETKDLTPANSFTSIDVDGVCDINITEGENCKVIVTADDNIYEYITIRESGNRLYVDLDTQGIAISNYTFSVEVTMPSLDLIDLDGVIDCDIRSFDILNDLTINVDGVSDLDSSTSSMAGNLTLSVEGTSSAALYGLVVTGNADLDISGVSEVNVDISGNIGGSIAGVSSLNYRTGTLLSSFDRGGITCDVSQD